MYTRKYGDVSDPLRIPSGYDGIALRAEGPPPPETEPPREADEAARSSCDVSADSTSKSDGALQAGLPFLGKLKDSLGLGRFVKFDIGFEEILLVALALYLFFSKDGDKECAIMLIILLFIT